MGQIRKRRLQMSVSAVGYDLVIGAGILESLPSWLDLRRFSQVAVLTDTNVGPLWLEAVERGAGRSLPVWSMRAGEEHKTLVSLEGIWSWMADIGMDRNSLLLNLGGGLVGDVGGFAASCYMRGVAFAQLPTTLLAQVDASVGGKVGINFRGLKNLLGAFQQPCAVGMDIRTFATLPRRAFLAGVAEMLKHGLIRDRAYFEEIAAYEFGALGAKEGDVLGDWSEVAEQTWVDWIDRSCAIKAAIVEADERESGLRKLLNFGHTVGHALETLSYTADAPLLHGEAVGLGMIVEAEIARMAGFLEEGVVDTLVAVLERVGLPTRLGFLLDDGALWSAMRADKKNVRGAMRWTLLQSMGEGVFDQRVEDAVVEAALQRIRS